MEFQWKSNWNIYHQKKITQFHEDSKISVIFLLLWISKKWIINGVPLNFTNIHQPKLIKILNLHPKIHFMAMYGLLEKLTFALDHPVFNWVTAPMKQKFGLIDKSPFNYLYIPKSVFLFEMILLISGWMYSVAVLRFSARGDSLNPISPRQN